MPEFVKSYAKKLLHKLADSIDDKDSNTEQNSSGSNSKPPATPPKPSSYSGYTGPNASQPALTSAFSNLSVSSAPPADPHFVGGFNPIYPVPYSSNPGLTPTNDSSYRPSSTPNLPMSMPSPISSSGNGITYPQSLTMQMALKADDDIRPNFGPSPVSSPLSKPSTPLSSTSKPGKPTRPSLQPQTTASSSGSKADSSSNTNTPTRPKPAKKPRKSKAKPAKDLDDSDEFIDVDADDNDNDNANNNDDDSSSSSPAPDQCAGVTKAGKRCTRKVKGGPALASYDFDHSEPNLPRFCHQHSKELMGPSGYYARKNGEWVDFETWIPGYLQPETQVSLRVEMEKSRTQSDVPGYIYTFEIREPTEKDTVKLKVGRAVNLVKRIDQWGKQCGSKEQVLRGFYPGNVEPDEDGGEGSLMKGRVKAGEKGPWCHRLERLIHLELADLVSTSAYLDSRFPHVAYEELDKKGGIPKSSSNAPCGDCGSMHKEIFEFERFKRGGVQVGNHGKEWERVVKPVIERWGTFVEFYV